MGKITRNELSPVVTAELDATMRGIADSNEQLGVVVNKSTLRDKELAYLKLKQDAADRIEGGTTFADDIQGNNFGITFNEELSENAVIRNGGLTMNEGAMVENNVNDSVVISGSYNTSGNGGRKLVRLDNGTLVCAVKTSTSYCLYKSVDNGVTWTSIYEFTVTAMQDGCIQTDGTYIYTLYCYNNNAYIGCAVFDETGKRLSASNMSPSQTALDTCSLAINEEGTELHACWSCKNSKYPSSFNIQYCKGVIGEGGTVTWGSVEQVTSTNTTTTWFKYPTITVDSNGSPILIYIQYNAGDYYVQAKIKSGDSWEVGQRTIFIGSSYVQSRPSAIFVPKSVNGLENGRIWVTWYGTDSTDTTYYNIKISYSDDGGQTWSVIKKLASGNVYDQYESNITVNKNNEVFIIWRGRTINSPTYYVLRKIKWGNDVWGEIEDIKQVNNLSIFYPSVLVDFNLDFTDPLCIYTTANTSINFTGTWQVEGYTPTTEATAVFNLPSTDYVGLFVQKAGSIDVTATINDEPMESELNGDEYQFTKALDAANDVTLKLSLSRSDTTNGDNDKITRILGGIA